MVLEEQHPDVASEIHELTAGIMRPPLVLRQLSLEM